MNEQADEAHEDVQSLRKRRAASSILAVGSCMPDWCNWSTRLPYKKEMPFESALGTIAAMAEQQTC